MHSTLRAVQDALRRVPGAFVSPSIDAALLPGMGIGVVARGEIPKDTLIFRAPQDAWYPFSSEFALREAQQKAPGFIHQMDALLSSTPAFRDRSSFIPNALLLGTHLAMVPPPVDSAPPSLTDAYIASLPEFIDLPFYWDETQFSALDGCSEVRQSIRQSAQLYFQLYQHLFGSTNQVVPPERFFWSISVLMSRATSGKDQPFTLIPFFDSFNHADIGDECVQEYDQQQQAFVIHTTRDYKDGEQLFINYGDHGNTRLLRNYGFTMANNAHDIVTLTLPSELQTLDAADLTSNDKMSILSALNLSSRQKAVTLSSSGTLTQPSSQWLQLRLADAGELLALVQQVVSNSAESEQKLMVPPSLSSKIDNVVKSMSEARLRAHKHKVEDDDAFLSMNERQMAPWLLGAMRIRLNEKRTLMNAVQAASGTP